MGGEFFVHLFSALDTITRSKGPNRIYATGGLRYYKDGRDVPDILTSVHDYPESDKHAAFNLQMRVNFVDGNHGGERLRLVGSEGVITVGWGSVKGDRSKTPKAPGYCGGGVFYTFFQTPHQKNK